MTSGILLADPETRWAVRVVPHRHHPELLRVKAPSGDALATYFILADEPQHFFRLGRRFASANTTEEQLLRVVRRLLLRGPEFQNADVQ